MSVKYAIGVIGLLAGERHPSAPGESVSKGSLDERKGYFSERFLIQSAIGFGLSLT